MRLILAICILLFLVMPAEAAGREVTIYLDGARFEQEFRTTRGLVEVSLPAAMQAGSLRIKPLDGSLIDQVEIVPARPDPKRLREIAKLVERKDALLDRLQALEAKESVFKAAAKVQSGKTPRKTKTNPDPLTGVRQGTEFAIAQLEGVYRVRRMAESDLKTLEARLITIKREGNSSIAKVRLIRPRGRIAVTYFRSDLKWIPCYDFRLNKAGEADVIIRAFLPKMEKGDAVSVAASLLAEAADEKVLPVSVESFPQIGAFTFPVERENISSNPISSITFTFRNSSTMRLPAAEASCYLRGEYMGKTTFSGALPGDIRELTFGK
jgi:hypothetical protein